MRRCARHLIPCGRLGHLVRGGPSAGTRTSAPVPRPLRTWPDTSPGPDESATTTLSGLLLAVPGTANIRWRRLSRGATGGGLEATCGWGAPPGRVHGRPLTFPSPAGTWFQAYEPSSAGWGQASGGRHRAAADIHRRRGARADGTRCQVRGGPPGLGRAARTRTGVASRAPGLRQPGPVVHPGTARATARCLDRRSRPCLKTSRPVRGARSSPRPPGRRSTGRGPR